jgi:hypothetical protein
MSLHVLIIFLKLLELHCVPTSFFYTLGPSFVPLFFQSFCIALLSISKNMLERSFFRAWSIYIGGDGKHVLAYS